MSSRRGQSTLEWVLLMAIMLAALLGAQRFLKASLMGQWRQTADTFGHGRQYDRSTTIN